MNSAFLPRFDAEHLSPRSRDREIATTRGDGGPAVTPFPVLPGKNLRHDLTAVSRSRLRQGASGANGRDEEASDVDHSVKKTWSALRGNLIFDITFRRDWRPGDAGTPAIAEVTSGYEPVETRMIEMRRDRPTDFRLRFASGCHVEGVLQELGHILVDGVDSLGVFADMRFCAPRSAEEHFEGLMVICPSRD